MRTKINVPLKDEVSPANQELFNKLEKAIGFVPNLYAVLAYSESALSTFLNAQNAKSSLTAKEKEIVSLVVSEVNSCNYCLSAHSLFASKLGFSEEQILEIRSGAASFDKRLDSLAKLAKEIAENSGHVAPSVIDSFLKNGYTRGSVMDVILLVGIRSITNYTFAVSDIAIDWPATPELRAVG